MKEVIDDLEAGHTTKAILKIKAIVGTILTVTAALC